MASFIIITKNKRKSMERVVPTFDGFLGRWVPLWSWKEKGSWKRQIQVKGQRMTLLRGWVTGEAVRIPWNSPFFFFFSKIRNYLKRESLECSTKYSWEGFLEVKRQVIFCGSNPLEWYFIYTTHYLQLAMFSSSFFFMIRLYSFKVWTFRFCPKK